MFEMMCVVRSQTPPCVDLRCLECGYNLSLEFDKFETINNNYVILNDNVNLSCPNCKNTQSDKYIPYQNTRHSPECPVCHSLDVEKIGAIKKYSSFAVMGVFSPNLGKQFHCRSCGYRF